MQKIKEDRQPSSLPERHTETALNTSSASMTNPDFRVAILKNYSLTAECGKMMLDEIASVVRQSKPNAEVNVYARIEGTAFPDLNYYDLIILTGGLFDLLQEEKPTWVIDTFDYIRSAHNQQPKAKLLGICWGQQAIALALGGSMAESPRGPCVRFHVP